MSNEEQKIAKHNKIFYKVALGFMMAYGKIVVPPK